MKNFKLDRWLRTKETLCTRDGRKVASCSFIQDIKFPHLVIVMMSGEVYTLSPNGVQFQAQEVPFGGAPFGESPLDLFFWNDEEDKTPKRGDLVWVKDEQSKYWRQRIFLEDLLGDTLNSCITVKRTIGDEQGEDINETNFKSGKYYLTAAWRKYTTKDPTPSDPVVNISITVDGVEVEDISKLTNSQKNVIRKAGIKVK